MRQPFPSLAYRLSSLSPFDLMEDLGAASTSWRRKGPAVLGPGFHALPGIELHGIIGELSRRLGSSEGTRRVVCGRV